MRYFHADLSDCAEAMKLRVLAMESIHIYAWSDGSHYVVFRGEKTDLEALQRDLDAKDEDWAYILPRPIPICRETEPSERIEHQDQTIAESFAKNYPQGKT